MLNEYQHTGASSRLGVAAGHAFRPSGGAAESGAVLTHRDTLFGAVPLERVREYWDRRPCNIRHSPREVGTREYFDEVEARRYFVESHIPRFAQFKHWRGKRVLEIGCGIGTDTISFARAGALVTAVDLSAASLALARRRAEVYGLDVQFYQADAENLTAVLPVDRYDLVYSFGVIHHMPHPERALEQLRHYMDGESTLKLMVYHRHAWKLLWILLSYGKGTSWNLDELVARYSEAQTGCPVTYTYTKQSIRDLLRGFEIVESLVEHIFPYRIRDYVQHRYVKERYFRYLPGPLFRWLERHWGWHLCVTARLAARCAPSA